MLPDLLMLIKYQLIDFPKVYGPMPLLILPDIAPSWPLDPRSSPITEYCQAERGTKYATRLRVDLRFPISPNKWPSKDATKPAHTLPHCLHASQHGTRLECRVPNISGCARCLLERTPSAVKQISPLFKLYKQ